MASIHKLLNRWRADPAIGGNIVAWETLAAREARFFPFPPDLSPHLSKNLRSIGITALYSHQVESWERIHSGQHIAIVTGTASGKTLCYNLPVLNHLLQDSQARALYIFPTKALAQDQLAGIRELLVDTPTTTVPLAPATYDGDTPGNTRTRIRNHSRLVVTNPDMLHTGILPHHTHWSDFFRHLRYVVIDEMHSYRGVFGSHVANTLRRLKRIARFYSANPQFVLTSATIGNPGMLATGLIEEPIEVIASDGSERGQKHFLIYNPLIVDPELGLRASMMQESIRLADDLLTYDVQTIIFSRTRRTVEIILRYLDPGNQLAEKSTDRPRKIRAYRSGYLPRQRRAIEAGLRDGEIRCVVATTALELGIDIGGMGAALLAGYPGTIAGTWQQVGRAGRGNDVSLAVLVASANPLDQFLAHHPEYFFGRSPEQALINPDNLLILLDHLRCAAFELPFQEEETFGGVEMEMVTEILSYLQESGILHKSGQKFFWMADQYPAAEISLRSASPQRILLQNIEADPVVTIGEVDWESAPWMVHPEAVYLHEGETYMVEGLDLESKIATIRPTQVDYYTRPRRETEVHLLEIMAEQPVPGGSISHGEITVITQVTGFQRVKWGTHENLGFEELSLPPRKLQTQGYWLALDDDVVERLRADGLWNSDPNRYGKNWAAQRDQARARDAYTCQVCGTLEQGRSHDVHHIKPFRSFASYQEANRLDNLITLCPGCHQRAESAVRVRSGLSGLAYLLEHLAPLFLMCDAGDIGLHVDPKSPLTNSRPTIVIYEMIPAGIGFSQRLFEIHNELISNARELASTCSCNDGCPSCVGPGGEMGASSKPETLAILDLLSRPNIHK
jgi:DEAD/DEAH box helicase domain-containing protein